MKLDFWKHKLFTQELNSVYMSNEHKWPMLDSILDAADKQIPMVSGADYGVGIYVGWVNASPHSLTHGDWFYHHAICLPGAHREATLRFRFTYALEPEQWRPIAESNTKILKPIFNVGLLPESSLFVKILNDHGIAASVDMPSMSGVELIKK